VPRTLIDVTRLFGARLLGRQPTGIDRVSLEYVRHYASSAQALLCRGRFRAALSREVSAAAFEALLDPRIPFGPVARRVIGSGMVRSLMTPTLAGCVLLNTGHMGLENQSWIATLRRQRAKPIFFVHDLIPISHPEYCRPGEHDRHVSRMRNALTAGSGIIANSRCTLEELEQFAKRIGLNCPPAVVAPLGLAPLSQTGPRPMDQPYFLILGTLEPRKNHWLLLHVWRRLVERMGVAAPRLVIVGKRGWECENVVDMLERCVALSGVVLERNDCSDDELGVYLRHARALLMPSFAEGYGLPVIEALGAGIPVIASDLAVFREVAGNVPDYVNPLDGPRWADLILQYASVESGARRAQLERMAAYQVATWQGHFTIVDAFLRRFAVDSGDSV
jgi:glycosyltransferase involved in cell wall biosynthesis